MTTDTFTHWQGALRTWTLRFVYARGRKYHPLARGVPSTGAPPDSTLDSDFDGVPDHRDREPGTLLGAEVDTNGVSRDDDGDGVPNGIDLDNNTPRGAEVDMFGISRDDDGDGVPNGIDLDNNTPAGTLVDQFGRPLDADHDGVDNGRDKCPDTPANLVVDAAGCPKMARTRVTQMLDKGRVAETRIYFETARATLLPESYPVLDTIGVTLSQFPSLRVQVGGHCDDRGADALNQRLSEERAQSVVAYLVSKNPGLTAERLTAKGFGRTQPVAAGTDEESRRRNRRVEFVVLNLEDVSIQKELQEYLRRGDVVPDTTRIGAPGGR